MSIEQLQMKIRKMKNPTMVSIDPILERIPGSLSRAAIPGSPWPWPGPSRSILYAYEKFGSDGSGYQARAVRAAEMMRDNILDYVTVI